MSKLAVFGGQPVLKPKQVGAYGGDPWKWSDLEEALCKLTGATYSYPVSNGTAALIAGLAGCGVGPYDEVITVGHTWVASTAAILRVNAIPIFVDIDPRTYMIDPSRIEAAITPRTKAIMPVDLFGNASAMFEIMEIANRHDLFVVEDACQSGGASIDGVKLGSIAHVTAFSCSGKPLSHGWGGGGFFTTNDRRIYEKALLAGQHGVMILSKITDPTLKKYLDFSGRGDNHRFPVGLTAQVMRDLESTEARSDWRIRNADFLTGNLDQLPGITPPYVAPGVRHVYHYWTGLFDAEIAGISRDLFLRALRAEGVPTIAYASHANMYFIEGGEDVKSDLMHRRSIFRELDYYGKGQPFYYEDGSRPDYSNLQLPVQERIHEQEFSLGQSMLSPPDGIQEMQQIVDAFKKIFDHIDDLKQAPADALIEEKKLVI
jgi:dTDP-4-amino-4,6-dideoxygalactose transaminase